MHRRPFPEASAKCMQDGGLTASRRAVALNHAQSQRQEDGF
jgi:hypothetical protein